MGSLASPPRPTMPSPSPSLSPSPSPSPEFPPSGYLVYIAFCLKDPTLSTNNNTSNWIECYDPSGNSSRHVSLIPGIMKGHVLKGFAMVSLGEMIYIIGGRLCHKDMVHVSDELADLVDIDDKMLSSVWRYNVRTNEWSRCAPLGVARSDFACTVSKNKIYVAGGLSNLDCARGISCAEVYNPILDEWTPLPSMNTVRYKCVGVTWQGKIHVVGGFVERLDSDKVMPSITERSSAEVFDPKTGTWELMAKMWQLDVPPNQIVAVDGKLFSSGDCLKAWKGHIEAYDSGLNIWNVVENSSCHEGLPHPLSKSNNVRDEHWPTSIKRLYLTMAPIGTHLYFLGGYQISGEPSQFLSMVCEFDTLATGDAWRSFEPEQEEAEKELCGHCCVVRL